MTLSTSAAPRVLVIDDDDDGRDLTATILRTAGFDVWEAATGGAGLARAGDAPDLIVLDILLPDVDGFEVCRRLRASPTTASIPLIFVTAAFRDPMDRVRGLDEGADGYLVRPILPNELVSTARALLRRHRSEERRVGKE